jgi:calcineurin-like phosphoesterase family protein
MNEYMIAKWNSVVRPGDTVLHLGDFALGMNEEEVAALVSKLHGTITLVRGNHDRFGTEKFKRCGFADVKKKIEFKNFILTHRPIPAEDLNGKINIHGHVHNKFADGYSINHVNVSVEMWDYTPIDFNELISNKTP